MRIHEIPGDPGTKDKRKRIGRGEGSGYGKTSGRGHKGALARAGTTRFSQFEGGQMPLARRIPKRGFHNPFRKVNTPVNIAILEARFEDGETVDPESLKKKGVVKSSECRIKILAVGDLTKKLTVKAHAFSKSAKEKIEAKGGQCEVLPC